MKADQHIYEFMYKRIPDVIRGSEVLELATGPGLLAKHIAPAAKRCRHATQWYMRSAPEVKIQTPSPLAKHTLRQTIPPTNSIGFIDCLSLLARC